MTPLQCADLLDVGLKPRQTDWLIFIRWLRCRGRINEGYPREPLNVNGPYHVDPVTNETVRSYLPQWRKPKRMGYYDGP